MVTHPIALGMAVFLAMMFSIMKTEWESQERKGEGKVGHRFTMMMWMVWTAFFAAFAFWQ